MGQFRIVTESGEATSWMDCKDWSVNEMELLAADINFLIRENWQIEYR